MVALLASTAPFRTASATSSCRGTLSGRRMSGIPPYSGRLNSNCVQSSVVYCAQRVLLGSYILHVDTNYFTMQKCLNATQGKRQMKLTQVSHMQMIAGRLQKQTNKREFQRQVCAEELHMSLYLHSNYCSMPKPINSNSVSDNTHCPWYWPSNTVVYDMFSSFQWTLSRNSARDTCPHLTLQIKVS